MRLAVRNVRALAARKPWGSAAAAVQADSSPRRPCWWRSEDIERSLTGCDGRAGAGWYEDRFRLRAGAPQTHAAGDAVSPAWRALTSDVPGGRWHSRRVSISVLQQRRRETSMPQWVARRANSLSATPAAWPTA